MAISERCQFFVLANFFFVLAKCVHPINSLYCKFHSLYAPQNIQEFLPVTYLKAPANGSMQMGNVIVQKTLQISPLNRLLMLNVPFTANEWRF